LSRDKGLAPIRSTHRTSVGVARLISILGYGLIALISLTASHVLVTRFGFTFFAIALVGLFFGSMYALVSFRALYVPLIAWILSVGGLRYLWYIETPLLPDLYLDRMMLIWLTVVFMIRMVVDGKSPRRPWKLDIMLILHAGYLMSSIYSNNMHGFHVWTMSTVIPYAAYFFAKNILVTKAYIRKFMWAMLALTAYYNVTAVAEKLNLDWLIWPKVILAAENEFVGRSLGPFLHAPVFGTVIGIMLPIHLYFIVTNRNLVVRVLLGISLAIGFAGLYFTYTRGSWLAGIAALGTVAYLNRRHYLRILAPAAIVAAFVAVVFLGLAQDEFMKERLENENTIGSRVGTAVTVVRIWKDYPLLGAGYFQYGNMKMNYMQPIEVPGLGTIRFNQIRHNVIHDIYLGPMAEGGILGTVLQIGIYFLVLRAYFTRFVRGRRDDPFVVFVLPVLGAITIGYLVGGMVIDYRYFAFLGTLFFVCAGIVDGYQDDEGDTLEEANH